MQSGHQNNKRKLKYSVLSVALSGFLSISCGAAVAAGSESVKPAKSVMLAKSSKLSMSELIKDSASSDWRPLNPENTLYMELEKGRVVIELAPDFAPQHASNIKALVREGYFDGLAVIRSQDNYVAQWGSPEEDDEKGQASAKKIKSKLNTNDPELTVHYPKSQAFTVLPDHDGYAPQVGHANGFPAARNPKTQQTWLAHCYASVGVGRGNEANSGDGSSLYVVNGHAPRHLDRNVTVVGRVMSGMELLSSLPRGAGVMGFYEKPEQMMPIKSVRIAADVPLAERSNLEIIRTDTKLFKDVVEALRNRAGDWYKAPAGHIELCNVALPVRVQK